MNRNSEAGWRKEDLERSLDDVARELRAEAARIEDFSKRVKAEKAEVLCRSAIAGNTTDLLLSTLNHSNIIATIKSAIYSATMVAGIEWDAEVAS